MTRAIPAGEAGLGPPLLRLYRAHTAQILLAVVAAVVAFLVLYPIGTIIELTFWGDNPNQVFGTIPWHRAFEEPGMVTSVFNTFKVVGANQAIALPIAICIAWFLARTNVPYARLLEFGFWILFFLPALGVTTGWLLFFDPDFGLVNRWLEELGLAKGPTFNLYSFWGIVFVHLTTYGIAVKVMLLTPAFRNLDASIEEASYVCGAGRLKTLIRIVLPIMVPAILVVLLMSVIRGLEAFEVELILGTPIKFQVYSTKIYLLMANSPPEYKAAGTLAVSILAFVLPLIVLQRWASTRRSTAVISGRASTGLIDLGAWRWPVFGILLTIVCCMSLLPLTLLVMGSFMKLFGFFDLDQVWTATHWVKAMADTTFMISFRNMLALGLGTAFLAVALYALVAYCTVRVDSRLRSTLDILTWLPLTIPGIILAFGYLNMALRVPIFAILYGTVGALILVSFLSAMTLGVQVLKVHMLQIGAEVEEAGRVVGGSWTRTYTNIVLPLATPALAVVGVMVFAATIRNVSNIIFLSTGDNRVLSVLQVELLSSGVLGPAAVIGTIIVLMSLTAAAIVRIVSARFGIRARG
jgi:iron(III) transport system permease protein